MNSGWTEGKEERRADGRKAGWIKGIRMDKRKKKGFMDEEMEGRNNGWKNRIMERLDGKEEKR